MKRWLGVAIAGLLLTACGKPVEAVRPDPGAIEGPIHVFAAASLTDVFLDLKAAFEAEHPDAEVWLNLAGSSALRVQILEGAAADVMASADESIMADVAEAGEVEGSPLIFARNQLQIAVPVRNPGGVTGLGDFSDERLVIGLCAEGVPCGDLARDALQIAGVVPSLDTNEPDVRALITKIADDEIDAGIVYVTDVLAAGNRVLGVEIADSENVTATYPIAILTRSPNPAGGAAFLDFVTSAVGRAILVAHGFGAP